MDTEKGISPRVNSARLANFVGQEIDGSRVTVEASDGGQVNVQALPNTDISETYIEVVGRVQDASTIQMHACINLGANLDMKLVNDTIELIHDPRFYSKIFS
ncbi:unnamed protein product [Cyclocybe aegerita]|uniref:Replication factor A protein 3 n=1 Tax=Cyclocybe aegerita TaxID=1973307 RepID=A0A8S0WBQ0_CYCAE|nr:unnamed protein product [Cyclocybe aegerita]